MSLKLVALYVGIGTLVLVLFISGRASLDECRRQLADKTEVVTPPPAPIPSPAPAPQACIYNDFEGYKFITFRRHGAKCYGVKRYGETRLDAFWCES